MRRDCRYGTVDPIQWPQGYSPSYEYLCAVRRRVSAPDSLAPLWWDPQQTDFKMIKGSAFKVLGIFKHGAIEPLERLVRALSETVRARQSPVDQRLLWLELAMRHAYERLRRFPCTYRDAVTQLRETQRYCLMAHAFLDFYDKVVPAMLEDPRPVRREYMGAFTTDPGVVQKLHAAGIPVWWIRSDVSLLGDSLKNVVSPDPPTLVSMELGPGQGHVLFSGLSGPRHLAATARGGHTYQDVSTAPLLAIHEDGGYSGPISQKLYKGGFSGAPISSFAGVSSAAGPSRLAPSHRGHATTPCEFWVRLWLYSLIDRPPDARPTAHPSQIRGRNKFEPFAHEWVTPVVDSWKWALSTVDLSTPARPGSEIWGRWLPEPATLLGSANVERRDRYIINWLRIRPAWLYLLRHRSARVTGVPTQWWRDVLNGNPPTGANTETHRARRWTNIRSVFGQVLEDSQYDDDDAYTRWHGFHLRRVKNELCPGILWELAELGFRYELMALDRLEVRYLDEPHREVERDELLSSVFLDGDIYGVADLPREPRGLCHPDPHRRVGRLEALRRVLRRWRDFPPDLVDQPILATTAVSQVVEVERWMVHYYVHMFFARAGRAPAVPHMLPPTAPFYPHSESRTAGVYFSDDSDSDYE